MSPRLNNTTFRHNVNLVRQAGRCETVRNHDHTSPAREVGSGTFFFDELARTELLLSISQRRAVSEANALLSGRWLYFVYSPLKLDFPLIAIGIL